MNPFNLFSRNAGRPRPGEIGYDELLVALAAKACTLVDVREPSEFSTGHVPGAINQPLSRFDPSRLPKGKPVVLICRSGARSANAVAKAYAAGRRDVRHYAGGVIGWSRAGGGLR